MQPARVLKISRELKSGVEMQARRDYPLETCGFLLGRESSGGREVRGVLEASNSSTGDPARFYQIDRAAYEAAEREAMASGMELIGIYHTHPDAPAVPSRTDGEFAFPDWIYWISPVSGGEPGKPRVWFRELRPAGWREWILEIS